jgi:hypothetical protein
MTYCTEGNINSDNPRGIHWNSLQDGFPHGQGEWKACENFPPCRIHRSIDPLGIVRPHFLQNWGWYGMVHQYRLVDARCVFFIFVPGLLDGTWRQRNPVARATWGNGRCYLGVSVKPALWLYTFRHFWGAQNPPKWSHSDKIRAPDSSTLVDLWVTYYHSIPELYGIIILRSSPSILDVISNIINQGFLIPGFTPPQQP